MNILITGGAGYIGSHTCISLLEEGHDIVVVDNLCNSDIEVISKIKFITNKELIFYNLDVTNQKQLDNIFLKHKIDGVIHFAGFKAVGESIDEPLKYYNNNLVGLMNIINACLRFNVDKFVFSSSGTVYGDNSSPFIETMKLLPTKNPYGATKTMSERILKDIVNANPKFSVSILRYFNPTGAHKSGLIGEHPNGTPNNLMPYITQVGKGVMDKLKIFGDTYLTTDGTGVRDYIHVVDLAEGHIAALNNMKKGINIYNLGTGCGTSVLQMLKTFEKTNDVRIPYEIVEKRNGDIDSCYADVSKAKEELGWSAKLDITDMCKDAWKFERNHED